LAGVRGWTIRIKRQNLHTKLHGGKVDLLAEFTGLPIKDFRGTFVEVAEKFLSQCRQSRRVSDAVGA